jgi:hypothetical protein
VEQSADLVFGKLDDFCDLGRGATFGEELFGHASFGGGLTSGLTSGLTLLDALGSTGFDAFGSTGFDAFGAGFLAQTFDGSFEHCLYLHAGPNRIQGDLFSSQMTQPGQRIQPVQEAQSRPAASRLVQIHRHMVDQPTYY